MLLHRLLPTGVLAWVMLGKLVAQPGTNDLSFNPSDLGNAIGDGPNGDVRAIAVQPDGKTLIGGIFGRYNGVERAGLARLLPDGGLDMSFVPQTGFYSPTVRAIAIQPDGKILASGRFLVGG